MKRRGARKVKGGTEGMSNERRGGGRKNEVKERKKRERVKNGGEEDNFQTS